MNVIEKLKDIFLEPPYPDSNAEIPITGPEHMTAVIFAYNCQICGDYHEIVRSPGDDPIAICPECAKRIKKLIYQEDDLK